MWSLCSSISLVDRDEEFSTYNKIRLSGKERFQDMEENKTLRLPPLSVLPVTDSTSCCEWFGEGTEGVRHRDSGKKNIGRLLTAPLIPREEGRSSKSAGAFCWRIWDSKAPPGCLVAGASLRIHRLPLHQNRCWNVRALRTWPRAPGDELELGLLTLKFILATGGKRLNPFFGVVSGSGFPALRLGTARLLAARGSDDVSWPKRSGEGKWDAEKGSYRRQPGCLGPKTANPPLPTPCL